MLRSFGSSDASLQVKGAPEPSILAYLCNWDANAYKLAVLTAERLSVFTKN